MDMFNIICGVCSIAGLLVSIFTAGKVVKISQTVNSGNVDDRSKTVNKVSKNSWLICREGQHKWDRKQ